MRSGHSPARSRQLLDSRNLRRGPSSFRYSSAAGALVAPFREPGTQCSAYLDLAQVTHELSQSNVEHDYTTYLKVALALLASAAENDAVPRSALQPLAETATHAASDDAQLTRLITRLRQIGSASPTSSKPNCTEPERR